MNLENVSQAELIRKVTELGYSEPGQCLKEWIDREIERLRDTIETADFHDHDTTNFLRGNIQSFRTLKRLLSLPNNGSAPGR